MVTGLERMAFDWWLVAGVERSAQVSRLLHIVDHDNLNQTITQSAPQSYCRLIQIHNTDFNSQSLQSVKKVFLRIHNSFEVSFFLRLIFFFIFLDGRNKRDGRKFMKIYENKESLLALATSFEEILKL